MNKCFIVFQLITLCFIVGCNPPSPVNKTKETLVIVSKKYDDRRFENWIAHFDSSVRVIGMYQTHDDSIQYYLQRANGIILSGGVDINPVHYGKPEEVNRCGKLDSRRDSLETLLIEYAIDKNIPILGICRGFQLMNVVNGGSLIVDIPSDFDTSVIHRIPNDYVEHKVKVSPNNYLASLCDTITGMVKSKHHQGIDRLADNFIACAYSPDSLIEAISWKDTAQLTYFVGVQWHPEMMDYNHTLSKPLIEAFLTKIGNRTINN